ncbi:DUF5686 and carboxypeptidase regulatory-like domain-containing protein [Nonlabens xiamenensis]|uniref:DUF5686 and carboxypeptidase regulatory-like domain-containing protein n=1 Tax=Nonlabens xiamenensis TaxID=2341043 RepID=UPI000F606C93|nr:DUF5686 and carboxypeptidase regulatory-like domain-containing protein [Nonlabens xiamenensis]
MKFISTSFVLFIISLLVSAFAKAQLTGTLTDTNNEPIAFASIYIKGTYQGTTTNTDGSYALQLNGKGQYEIVYQSLGYEPQTISVDFIEQGQVLDVQLKEEVASLEEIVLQSDENPAERVIREAIAHREENRRKFSSYTANFYSRGIWRMEDVPEKFLGQEIGDLEGSLDSVTRSGVIYLSETFSKIAYQAPDNFKEHIVASKISGDDNGFSANSAESANFDFYNNNIDLNNRIVSPIADYAFGYYRYKLLGTFYDDNNFLINKIQVTSRRPKDNTFDGIIYIVEDQWTIYGLELTTLGENINVPAIDSITFNQDFTYEPSSGDWVKRSQSIDFSFGLFGFKGNGRFIANYTDYNFDPQFEKSSFGPEVLSFERDANKKDSTFWNTKRPVPLTVEETKEYIKKDSISTVRNDPKYKDSVDRARNKFQVMDLLNGYTYRNSKKNERYTYNGFAGLDAFKGFNTVQGFMMGTGVSYYKGFDEDYNSSLYIGSDFTYGFSDDRLRYTGRITYRFNRINYRYLTLSGGTETRQINNSNPITGLENMISSLMFERNFAKFYEVDFGRIGYGEELFNGLFVNASVAYERRQPLINTTDQVWFTQSDVDYTSNNPLELDNGRIAFIDDHQILKAGLDVRLRFGQKYQSYPDRKYNITNEKYPTVYLNYEGGFASDNSNYNFQHLRMSLTQGFDMGNLGRSSYWANAGTFFNAEDISFVDYRHFNGNQLRYKLSALNPYSFGLLSYYDYSTNEDYAQVHLQHDFKGFILGKVPGINRLNLDMVLSGKALFTERKPYFEASAGINNIGWGKFRPFRVDYVHSITSGRNYGAFIFGANLGF